MSETLEPTIAPTIAPMSDLDCEAFQEAPSAYLYTTPQGIIVAANRAFVSWTGYSSQDLLGKTSFWQLLTLGSRLFAETHLQPMLKLHGVALEIALELRGADSRTIPVLLNANRICGEQGQARGLRIMLFRASERRGYEKELLQAKKQSETALEQLRVAHASLEALNQEKNRFLGMAAHDLRNPLGGIQSLSQFLLEGDCGLLSPEQFDFVQAIHESSTFMLRLVNDLLDVSKIESGLVALELKPTLVAQWLESLLPAYRRLASRKQIEIALQAQTALPPLWIDPVKMQQLLDNLVTNAIKFSHPGTQVTILLERCEQEACLHVRDQGQGIPEGEIHKLFQPFCSTNVRPTGGEDSTGLGLAIAKKIAEAHRGRIWVASQVGSGSTFSVALPLA
jgi:PAS domain S-box-containing protein